MPVCLALAQAIVALLPTDAFSLIWTHSVEKTEWREEWRVDDGRLQLTGAAVAGSGAGMEPPAGAIHEGGTWRYVPDVGPLKEALLAASPFGGDYRLCWQGTCARLSDLLPQGFSGPVALSACVAGDDDEAADQDAPDDEGRSPALGRPVEPR